MNWHNVFVFLTIFDGLFSVISVMWYSISLDDRSATIWNKLVAILAVVLFSIFGSLAVGLK